MVVGSMSSNMIMIKIYAPRKNAARRNRLAKPSNILFIIAVLTRTVVSVVR